MPQPVVSRRYLFLCSPPKKVFTFSPDSRATLRKLTPRSGRGAAASFESAFGIGLKAFSLRGRTNPKTPSSDKSSAERLRDFRNTRREGNKGNKRSLPGVSARARIRPYSLYSVSPIFASSGGG